MIRSPLLAAVVILAITACGQRFNGIKPMEFARPGHKSTLPQVIYEEKGPKQTSTIPEFTLINAERNNSGLFGHLSQSNDSGPPTEPFNAIGVNPRANYEPTKHTRITRSFKDIQDFNKSTRCADQLNDLAEIKSLYPNAILICDKQFAATINNASMITLDSQSYTSWSRSTFEFLSARVIIHHF
jgi:hypothetical protein